MKYTGNAQEILNVNLCQFTAIPWLNESRADRRISEDNYVSTLREILSKGA
jgi:hypothetical protein